MNTFYNTVIIAQVAIAALLVIGTIVALIQIKRMDKKNNHRDYME